MSDEIVVPGDYGFGPIRVVHVTSDPVPMVVAFRRRVDGGEDGVDGLVLSPRQAAPLARALDAAAGPAPEAEAFTASGTPPGLYDQIVAEAESEGLMREFPVAAAPPLLPPLTAVQRAWVVGMAEAEGVAGLGPRRINWVVWTVWASRRWGKRRAAVLRSLSSAVSHWRLEQGARDAV